jgi:formylglycine-generating enzyme required for sulfatase activity
MVEKGVRDSPPARRRMIWAKVKGLRGGSWNNNENNARVSIRNNNHPNNRNNNIGFRVVALHGFAIGSSIVPKVLL